MRSEDHFSLGAINVFLRYDIDAGRVVWRRRNAMWFQSARSCASWNAKYAEQDAGSISAIGYRELPILGHRFYEHRVVWLFETGDWPEGEIDHIDGNRTHNHISNLRDVSRHDNAKNVKMLSSNTSGATGVYQRRDTGKWQAQIKVQGKKKSLGCFTAKEDAVDAYQKAKMELGFTDRHGQKELD